MRGNAVAKAISSVLAVVLVLSGVSACTVQGRDLPSISGTSPSRNPDVEAAARLYYDCMTDAGISVTMSVNDQGRLTLVDFGDAGWILERSEYKAGVGGTRDMGTDPEFVKMAEAFLIQGGTGLIIDGVDHSEAFARCLDKSGYVHPESSSLTGSIDAAEAAKQVQANNQWTACARENGWPRIADSRMPTDLTWSQWPTVVLPDSITEEQLRQLLKDCPPADGALQKRLHDWWDQNPKAIKDPEWYLPDPNISFDQDPAGTAGGGQTAVPDAQAEMDRISRLYDVLYEVTNKCLEDSQ